MELATGIDLEGTTDVAVIGGGLGGLAAAAYLARAGQRVVVLEKARTLGGRAVTHTKGDFRFNLGPHALYRDGHGVRVLRELGVRFSGGTPSAAGGFAVNHGIKHALPGGFVSLLTTGLLRLPAKLETARLLGTLPRIKTDDIQHVSVRAWLDRAIRHPDVRSLVQALLRLATYANAPEHQSAGAAVAQLQMALAGNVTYLDDGWQVLVDGLRAAAAAAGARFVTGAKVVAIEHDDSVRAIRLADGTLLPVAAVIAATPPDEALALVRSGAAAALRKWVHAATPVKAACLDVALGRLPQPQSLFALGIDRPLYLSVHSAVARLAPTGGATIHVAKYLPVNAPNDPKSDELELEQLLDLVQPGWRAEVVERRFLPGMTVYDALVTAEDRGAAGRPGPAVPDIRQLYVVGDWVGSDGLLADASLASARRAAELVASTVPRRAVAAA